MNGGHHYRRVRKGFTLVELLVVISIITILISLLLPALNQAREFAQSTECLSNQRQITTAARAYRDDFNKLVPMVTQRNINGGLFSNTMLGPYVEKNWDVFLCPTAQNRWGNENTGWFASNQIDNRSGLTKKEKQNTGRDQRHFWWSYTPNGIMSTGWGWTHTKWDNEDPGANFHHGATWSRTHDLAPHRDKPNNRYPSETIFWLENRHQRMQVDRHQYGWNVGNPGRSTFVHIVHGGKTNYAFVDGHAETRAWYSVTPDLLSGNNGDFKFPKLDDIPKLEYNER